jgi:outer membrane biogenesis lipoprotein LolB
MRLVLLVVAMAALFGCAEKSGSKSFIGIDAYQEESRRWKQGEDGDMRFGRYSTHRYAATQHGVSYTPTTSAWGQTQY